MNEPKDVHVKDNQILQIKVFVRVAIANDKMIHERIMIIVESYQAISINEVIR